MKSRNIKAEFLDVGDYKDETTNEVDEEAVVDKIEAINPDMLFIVICYSSKLNLKFLLESRGVLAKMKTKRDLCIQSRGKILTMSEVQKEFLDTMAKPENIEKKLVQIQGQVGSGKTLMGLEVIKMKLGHYLKSFKLTAGQGKELIRVIIVIAGLGRSDDLKEHLENELRADIGQQSYLEIHNDNLYGGDLQKIIESKENFSKFKKTLIMIDECIGSFMKKYTVKELEDTINMD